MTFWLWLYFFFFLKVSGHHGTLPAYRLQCVWCGRSARSVRTSHLRHQDEGVCQHRYVQMHAQTRRGSCTTQQGDPKSLVQLPQQPPSAGLKNPLENFSSCIHAWQLLLRCCDFTERVKERLMMILIVFLFFLQSEERPWSRGSPPCTQPGSPPLMLISMRGGS